MMHKRFLRSCAMRYKAVAAALLIVPALIPAAHAQSWPARTVRIIAPSSPGSGVDIVSRLVAQKLSANLGQQVVVDNRAGAGGNLGAEIAAKAAADGHTLFMATPSFAINPALYGSLNYDAVRDFAPISLVMTGQYMLMAHPSLPAKTVPQLIALAEKVERVHADKASCPRGLHDHLVRFGEAMRVPVMTTTSRSSDGWPLCGPPSCAKAAEARPGATDNAARSVERSRCAFAVVFTMLTPLWT